MPGRTSGEVRLIERGSRCGVGSRKDQDGGDAGAGAEERGRAGR